MPADELDSIPGLSDKYRHVLTERLQITTFQTLVAADRRVIFAAMRRLRPHPDLEEIARWQDHARDRLGERGVGNDASDGDWEGVASFVVSFEQHLAGQESERRLVVQQTELEVEQPGFEAGDWDCREICRWMQSQLSHQGISDRERDQAPEASPGTEVQPHDAAPARDRADQNGEPTSRARLRIEHAEIIDATGRIETVSNAAATEQDILECTPPGRFVLTVSGATREHEVQVVVRLRRLGGRGPNPFEPRVLPSSGRVEFELSDVAPGRYHASLVAWRPDRSANPALVKLPLLSVNAPRG